MYFPKDDFIGIEGVHHLAAGGETPFLKHHLAAVAQFATDKAGGMLGRERFFVARERVCTMLAQMLNVEATDVALVGSSSAGMIQVVSAYDWRSGDEVVTVDDEYPSGRYLFTWLARYGVTAVMPAYDPNPDNEVDAIVAAITSRTRLVYVSHVSTRTGRRIDLAPIAAAAHRVGAQLMVDATHSLGVVAVDASNIDFLVCSGYKWLLGSHLGILVWNRRLVQEFHPLVGWRSAKPGVTPHDYLMHPDAARAEVGNPNFVDVYILESALRYHTRIPIDVIEAHALHYGGMLRASFAATGAQLLTPADARHRAGNICVGTEQAASIVQQAATHNVLIWGDHDLRRIRVSVHAYVTPTDVDVARTVITPLLAKN
jgi:selenocysteine lyase/cysteine desulfurase